MENYFDVFFSAVSASTFFHSRIRVSFWLSVFCLAVLILHSPHSLDLAVSQAAWDFFGGHWAHGVMPVLYKAQKMVPIAIAVAAVFFLILAGYKKKHAAVIAWSLFLLSLALGTIIPTQLRSFSGVACPWSVEAFHAAGAVMIDPFSWLWTNIPKQGACWPSGHACAGFALLGSYFLLQRLHKPGANWVLWLVLAYGTLCTFTRIAQGAHFLSHGIASLAIDWIIACLIFLGPKYFLGLGAKKSPFQRDTSSVR